MLYKHLFSILCGHLNLNQKRKKIEFGRLPVKPTGIPVKPASIPVRTGCNAKFEFKFEFHRYRPVSDQTGPVYRYRTAPVWPDRSESKTLGRWHDMDVQIAPFVREEKASTHCSSSLFFLGNKASFS